MTTKTTAIRGLCNRTLMVFHYSDNGVILDATPARPDGSVHLGVTIRLSRAEADELIEALKAPEAPTT